MSTITATPSQFPPRHEGHVYIYRLIDPRTNEVRYIGKAVDLHARLRAHINRKAGRAHRDCWLQNLRDNGLEPVMELVGSCFESEWEDFEKMWIADYRKAGCDLVNATAGGDGSLGLKHRPETIVKLRAQRNTPEHRKRMSLQARFVRTPETRRRLSVARKGRKMPDSMREKRRIYMTGRKLSEETKAKMRAAWAKRKAKTDH